MKDLIAGSIGLVGLLTLTIGCGENPSASGLNASVSKKIEEKWSKKVELTKEISFE
ncbi:MAG: hypothetical protein H7249_13440 [Chitinophagaceae bacterium]|nr:hypothetical protein [Oligoflexus sp.]